MRIIHRTIVSALIFSKDGKLLMGMKDPKDGGVYADCWHIPGGGVDEGETKEQALRREVLEEVGIDITNCKGVLVDDQGTDETEKTLKDTGEKVLCKMQFNVYQVDIDRDADKIRTETSDDLVELEWVDLGRLTSYELTPPSTALFHRLGYLSPKAKRSEQPKPTTLETSDGILKITFVETQTVKEGVTADLYIFDNDAAKDLALVQVAKGYKTPLQRVLKGTKTIEGYMSGDGTLTVTIQNGSQKIYTFTGNTDTNPNTEIEVRIGELMQWSAKTSLTFYEICEPPYEDGRFENIEE